MIVRYSRWNSDGRIKEEHIVEGYDEEEQIFSPAMPYHEYIMQEDEILKRKITKNACE